MTEELRDKELTVIKYLRARMTGNVGLALDQAYNLGFFEGKKSAAEKIRAEIEFEVDHRTNMLCAEEVFAILDKYKVERSGEE